MKSVWRVIITLLVILMMGFAVSASTGNQFKLKEAFNKIQSTTLDSAIQKALN